MSAFHTRLKQFVVVASLATLLSGCTAVGEQPSSLREPFGDVSETPRAGSRLSRLTGASAESRQIERNLGIR